MSVPGFELCSAIDNSVSLSFSFWQKDALAFFFLYFVLLRYYVAFSFDALKRVEN